VRFPARFVKFAVPVDGCLRERRLDGNLSPVRAAAVPEQLARGPFTTARAEAAGLTRHALRGPAWRQLFRGVWIVATATLDRSTWVAAAHLVLPVDAVLCGLSGAEAFGLDVRPTDDVVVHAAFTRQVARRRPGMRLYELGLCADEVTCRGTWLVTTAARTAFDCARWLPLTEAVVVLDALLHLGLTTPEEVAAVVDRHRGERWVRRVAGVLSLADGRSESPMESRLRVLLVRAGLTGIEPQYVVRTAAGVFVGRLDLAFVAAKVAVEYDGAWHWQQRRNDDRRRDALRALGWTVIVVSAEDYYSDPHDIIRGVREALAQAAA
jgi:very-short-patch-repair endonuclease